VQIFDENAAKHFPPSRPEDHAIRLKPGAPSEINCKIYPLTKQEMIATREFLDKNLALGYCYNTTCGLQICFLFFLLCFTITSPCCSLTMHITPEDDM
jgi:hypothetical protein